MPDLAVHFHEHLDSWSGAVRDPPVGDLQARRLPITATPRPLARLRAEVLAFFDTQRGQALSLRAYVVIRRRMGL